MRKSRLNRRAMTLAAAAAGAVVSLATHSPAQTTWIAGSGTWIVPSNWSNGVPAANTDAIFPQNNSYQVFFSGPSGNTSVGNVNFNGGTVDLVAQVAATINLGSRSLNVGTLNTGSASGATAIFQTGQGTIATAAAFVGAGTASGTLRLGNGWQLSATNLIDVANGGNGTISLSGAGTGLRSGSVVHVGAGSFGNGMLSITNAATMSVGDLLYIGFNTGNGSLIVDGAGSSLSVGNTLIVGGANTLNQPAPSSGTVTLFNGGSISAMFGLALGALGGRGIAVINGGTFTSTNGAIQIGSNTGGTPVTASAGTLLCTGSATLNFKGMSVGSNGGSGTAIFSGANNAVTSTGSFNIGPAGTGIVRVAGTNWTHGGDLYVGGSPSTTTGVGTLVVDAGASLSIAGATQVYSQGAVQYQGGMLSLGSLSVMGGLVDVAPAGNRLLRATSVATSSGGDVDLHDNDMLVTSTPYAQVAAQIAAARAGGAWTGAGITTAAARDNPAHNTTLGAVTGAEYLSVYGAGATFDDAPVASGDVLVKYTWYGDTDFNGRVNFDDYVRTDNGFNNHLSGWFNGDFDLNGVVNFDDYVLIDLAFNTQSGTLDRAVRLLSDSQLSSCEIDELSLRMVRQHLAQFGTDYAQHLLSAVPEPQILSILMLSGLLPLLRRRTKSG